MAESEKLKALLKEIEKANKVFTGRVVSASDDFVKAALKAQRDLLDKISKMIADAPDFKTAEFNKTLSWNTGKLMRINKMIAESGYPDMIRDYAASYKEFAKLAEKTFLAAGWDPAFSSVSSEYVKFMRVRDVEYLNFLGREAAYKVNDTIFEMSIGGYSRGDMVEELRGVITGKYPWGEKEGLYEWHAGTYVRTQSSNVQQAFMNHQAEKAGAENFTYVGPFDQKIRPFCAGLLGGTYTKAEIMQMDNGQTGDVLFERGGWNCRHQWIAVPA